VVQLDARHELLNLISRTALLVYWLLGWRRRDRWSRWRQQHGHVPVPTGIRLSTANTRRACNAKDINTPRCSPSRVTWGSWPWCDSAASACLTAAG